MPNTFANLNVPTSDAVPGTPLDVQATGRPKTLVFDGPIRPGGRYIVEGSTNGGTTWDVLVGVDGVQACSRAPTMRLSLRVPKPGGPDRASVRGQIAPCSRAAGAWPPAASARSAIVA